MVRSQGVNAPVPLPSAWVVRLVDLMTGLPRGMESPAVSPRDFSAEMDVEGIDCPLRRRLFHRLRRAWVAEQRSIMAEDKT